MEIRRQEDAPVMVMFIERTSKILNFNKNEACDDSTITEIFLMIIQICVSFLSNMLSYLLLQRRSEIIPGKRRQSAPRYENSGASSKASVSWDKQSDVWIND